MQSRVFLCGNVLFVFQTVKRRTWFARGINASKRTEVGSSATATHPTALSSCRVQRVRGSAKGFLDTTVSFFAYGVRVLMHYNQFKPQAARGATSGAAPWPLKWPPRRCARTSVLAGRPSVYGRVPDRGRPEPIQPPTSVQRASAGCGPHATQLQRRIIRLRCCCADATLP